jgi:hypothetical protein
MKKLLLVLTALLGSSLIVAQNSSGITYQAVIRDGENQLLSDSTLNFKFTILTKGTNSSEFISFIETQELKTSSSGLATAIIGKGESENGAVIDELNWSFLSNESAWIRTEIDIDNDGTYDLTMENILSYVPFAYHANIADSVKGGISYSEMDPIFDTSIAAGITAEDTARWNSMDVSTSGGHWHAQDSFTIATDQNVSIGWPGATNKFNVLDTSGNNTAGHVYLINSNSSSSLTGFIGEVAGGSNVNRGVLGLASGDNGIWNEGVTGISTANTSDSSYNVGVYGLASNSAGTNVAVRATTNGIGNENLGVYGGSWGQGEGINIGLDGVASGSSYANYAVRGFTTGAGQYNSGLHGSAHGQHDGTNRGVNGYAINAKYNYAVRGITDGTGSENFGIYGLSSGQGDSITNRGVHGHAEGSTTENTGVFGYTNGSGTYNYGVEGISEATGNHNVGVHGSANGQGDSISNYGTYGYVTKAGAENYAIYGKVDISNGESTINYSGFFEGAPVQVKDDDIYVKDFNKGVVLTSPNGQCWRVTVGDDGSMSTLAIDCP